MTKMRDLLKYVLQEFINEVHYSHTDKHYDGLCTVVRILGSKYLISSSDEQLMFNLIRDKLNDKLVTYTSSIDDGVVWHIRDNGVYIWKPYEKKPRIKWLKTLIKQHRTISVGDSRDYF